jgi:hypothetical protein
MAGKEDFIIRLVALIGAFDDAAWEALASKGLLRRARKDLAKGIAIEIAGASEAGVELTVPPFRVVMPLSGPAKSTCTCPAHGVCQHILAAGLYLEGAARAAIEARQNATPDSIREEVASITAQRLKEWAGAAEYRAGATLLEKNSLPPVIEYGDTVVIRLMPSCVEALYVPGGGLDGIVGPRARGKRVVVAAVLVLRRSLGLETAESGVQQALIEVSGAPRTPKEVLASAQSVLEGAVTVGLSHLSPAVVERLLTLAVSAQAANLPRVSLALRGVSDEVRAILERDARADESRLLLSAASLYALIEAISKCDDPSAAALVGVARRRYVEVPEMELLGVGAHPWKTGSGYRGLTVLFWSSQSREFLSWSAARPASQQFDPRQRFEADGPWDGARSPRQVASSHIKLRNAQRTGGGRISASTRTTALVLAPTSAGSIDFGERRFLSWYELDKYVREKEPLGLRESNPLDMVVVLEPAAFGSRSFDSTTQTFRWDLHDAAGLGLTLSLPFREWTKDAIRALEGLAPPEGSRWRVVVRVARGNDGPVVEPISILRPENHEAPVFHLAFDVPSSATSPKEAEASEEPDEAGAAIIEEQDAGFSEPRGMAGGYTQRILGETIRRLDAISEGGSRLGLEAHRGWFNESRRGAFDSGLTSLARVLDSLADPSMSSPRVILQARYLIHLHMQAMGHAL